MNAPLHIPDRTYWQPLGLHAAADMGARVEPMQHGHEVWHMGDTTMLVRVIDGVPHGLDVCGGNAPFTGWVRPARPFSAVDALAVIRRRVVRDETEWERERYAAELAAERRADARDEARDYRRRSWREKSFQIE